MYKDIAKPEVIPGIKFWQNPGNKFHVLMLHYHADPDKDPDRKGKEWYDAERSGAPKSVWLKEYEIDFTTKAGLLVYGQELCDFSPETHFINSFEFEDDVTYMMALDFGQRNPTAGLVAALTKDNRIYIIDEYYKPAIPSVSSREMFDKFGYLMDGYDTGLSIDEKRELADATFEVKVIDPTTAHKNRTKVKDGEEIPYSVLEDFYDNGWEFDLGNNDWDAGVTRVREYMMLDETEKPHLYIFQDKCPKLCWELTHYRYQELKEKAARGQNESEKPVKKNDHGMDSLRYLIMTRPNKPEDAPKELTRIQKDIRNLTRPRILTDQFDVD